MITNKIDRYRGNWQYKDRWRYSTCLLCYSGTNDCKHPMTSTCRQCEDLCNRYCEQFEEEVCTHRFKPPYVCNGCREVKKCTLTKTVYDALEAQRQASEKIAESRSGILSTEGEIARLNENLLL